MLYFALLVLALLSASSAKFIQVPGQCTERIKIVNGFSSVDLQGSFEVLASSNIGPQNYIRHNRIFPTGSTQHSSFPVLDVYTTPENSNITVRYNVSETPSEGVFHLNCLGGPCPKKGGTITGYALRKSVVDGDKLFLAYGCGNSNTTHKLEEISVWSRRQVTYVGDVLERMQHVLENDYPSLNEKYLQLHVVPWQ